MNVVLVARRGDRLRALAARLEAEGGECRVVEADLTTEVGVREVVEAVRELDVGLLVNNAGEGYVGPVAAQEPDRLERLVKLNCTAVVLLTRLLLPGMLQRRRGALLFVSSRAALQPLPLHALYAATKSLVSSFGEALAEELRGTGLRVLVTEPGSIRTDFSRTSGSTSGRGRSPEIVAQEAVDALAGDHAPRLVQGSFLELLTSGIAQLLPLSLLLPLARRRQEGVIARTPH